MASVVYLSGGNNVGGIVVLHPAGRIVRKTASVISRESFSSEAGKGCTDSAKRVEVAVALEEIRGDLIGSEVRLVAVDCDIVTVGVLGNEGIVKAALFLIAVIGIVVLVGFVGILCATNGTYAVQVSVTCLLCSAGYKALTTLTGIGGEALGGTGCLGYYGFIVMIVRGDIFCVVGGVIFTVRGRCRVVVLGVGLVACELSEDMVNLCARAE